MSQTARAVAAPHFALLVEDGISAEAAATLQFGYGLERVCTPPDHGFYLFLGAHGLELRQAGQGAPGPVRVDFRAGPLAHRLRFGGGRRQPLARAVGMKPGFNPAIWDATAGLGRDALVLASLGSSVTLCERAPLLAALLHDALQRACQDSGIGPWVEVRMHLLHADSITALAKLDREQQPDVVYLDPMYPPGRSSALVKKDMRALQVLLGGDRDSGLLLDAALASARRRVVVKRPRSAAWLAERKPDAEVESRNTRFDIYVTLT
jgi:16S rRNA (guanine1516-N2)-methyltransferase